MFIGFILIVLFILLGVLAGAYSVFAPFTQNIGDVIDFNSAYYGAIAGIERANLVLKYKSPGFEGSGGFLGAVPFGPRSDNIQTNFGNLKKNNNGFSWTIRSRTSSIPASGDGNIDTLLASSNSVNYNELPYFTTEKIYLSIDTTNDTDLSVGHKGVYDPISTFSYFHGGTFSGQFRLPSKIITAFSGNLLCDNSSNPLCDIDGDSTFDDIAVNWGLKGNYSGVPFSILPNAEVYYRPPLESQIITNRDTMIRESVINTTSGAVFLGNTDGSHNFNPILGYSSNLLNKHNVISSNPSIMNTIPFNSLLTDSNTTGLQFSFDIVNLLRSMKGDIYPFLEYQLNFGTPVANRFYTIEGASLVGNYNVRIIMKKSTNSDNPISDFTVIF